MEARSIVANVLAPGENIEKVETALNDAQVVLDFSASVPVARYLSNDVSSSARRVSVFLNPCGTDLVILAEDKLRSVTLADLEMQLYRAMLGDDFWRDHLLFSGEKIRYARSCGDLSGRIPQDHIATHAATASRALRRLISTDESAIQLWRLDPENDALTRRALMPESVVEVESNQWKVRTDQGLIRKVRQMRSARLPVETGGVLIGTFDTQRRIVYIIDALPAPSDSEERRDSFVRGCAALRERIVEIEAITANQVIYAGEWHSHPRGYACQPSRKDFKLFKYLAEQRLADGLPPLMLIVSDDASSWFVDEMPEPVENVSTVIVVNFQGGSAV